MSNYKDVDAIVKEIEKLPDTYDKKTLKKCLKIINKIPLSDMKPIVHGKWESKNSIW